MVESVCQKVTAALTLDYSGNVATGIYGKQYLMMFNVVGGVQIVRSKKRIRKKRKSLEELYGIAILREGKCLSSTYYDVDTKLKWECKYGHQWESTPYSITRMEAGVLFCAYKKVGSHKKGTIEDMQSLAKKNKGICLSDTYVNSQAKLLWECKEGHQWYSNPNSVQQGSWCSTCRKNEISCGNRENPSLK